MKITVKHIFRTLSYLLIVMAIPLYSMSCNKISDEESFFEDITNSDPYASIVDETYNLWDVLYGSQSTKSNGKSRPRVASIGCCRNLLTRSDDGTRNLDTLVYILNFENNEGFSVVSAVDNHTVLALTESGSLDATKMEEAIQATSNEESGEHSFSSTSESDYVYYFLAQSIKHGPVRTRSTICTDSTATYEILSKVDPMIMTKWGQDYPFNQSMTVFSGIPSRFHGHAPVGCGLLTIAQIMMYVNHPTFYNLTNLLYSWGSFYWVSPFNDIDRFRPETYDTSTTTNEKYIVQNLSQVFPILAEACNASSWVSNQKPYTSTYPEYIVDGLKTLDSSYYGNASLKYVNWYMSTLISMLDNDRPAFMRGDPEGSLSEYNNGHSWLVDGYLLARRTWGLSIVTQYYLHCNWGWRGENDGYYSIDSFLPADRVFYEEMIDPVVPQVDTNYNCFLKFIYY